MPKEYPTRQSTDYDAFEEPADTSQANSFAPGLGPEGSISRAEIRSKALEAVHARAKSMEGGGRMKGKVGVITGVGPEMGIGVSVVN
jgi:hypothetical protein